MKHYFNIYKQLLKLNLQVNLAYRVGFINNLIASIGWGLFQILMIYLLTAKVKSIYGWSREGLILLSAVFNIFVGIFHAVFSRNFGRFSQIIHRGELDMLLIKPIDTQFAISFWWFSYSSLSRIILGFVFVFYLTGLMHVPITIFSFIEFFILLFFGIVILYSIWLLICTLLIWFTNLSNLVDFLYTINTAIRYPREMFQGMGSYIFLFFLPFTFVIVTPTKALLQTINYIDLFGVLFFSIILLFVSRKFWKFALKYYTSASG